MAWLTIIAQVLKLVSFISAQVHDRQQQNIGYAQALADVLEQAHKDLAIADAAQIEADQAHARDPSDGAFDNDFRRD